MSSSFLKPSVTPNTALATRLRASPWNFARSASGRSSDATRVPSCCAKSTPGGTICLSFPFGPWTSTASPAIFTDTPFGIGIGFFPMRDIFESCWPSAQALPHVAQHFAADAGLLSRAPRHHASGRGEDVRPQSTEHGRHIVDTKIDAATRPADALDAGDDALAARAVLQEHPDDLPGLPPFLVGRLLDDPET